MRILDVCLPQPNARVVDGFLDYLKIEKGLAPLTVAAYTTDIGQFAVFLEKHKRTLLNAQRNHVREFIQQLFGNSVDGRSVGRKLSALRHLYRYLLLDKMIEHDPTLNIDSPKQWKVLPKALARDEMDAMLTRSASDFEPQGCRSDCGARSRHAGSVSMRRRCACRRSSASNWKT